MRAKTLLLACLLLAAIGSWAQGWIPKTNQDFEQEKVFLVNLKLNPEADPTAAPPAVRLGAFIDGECRAVGNPNLFLSDDKFEMRVAGDPTDDFGKDIVFKAFVVRDNYGLVYEFLTKGKFDNNPDAEFPFELTLDLLTSVTVDETIKIEASLPTTYDLTPHIHFNFGANGGPSENVKLEDGQLTYQWMTQPEGEEAVQSIVENVLTTKTIEKTEALTVTITGKLYEYDEAEEEDEALTTFSYIGSTQVDIKKVAAPVTSIVLNPTSIDLFVGDNIATELVTNKIVTVTVLPADASNKNYSWDFGNDAAEWINTANGTIIKDGIYTVTCKSVSNPDVTATLTVNVKQHPTFSFPSEIKLSLLADTKMTFTNLTDKYNLFDPTKVSVKPTGETSNGDAPFKVTVAADGKSCTLRGQYAGDYGFEVLYGNRKMLSDKQSESGTAQVEAEIALPSKGWDWVSVCYVPVPEEEEDEFLYIPLLDDNGSNVDFLNNVIEMRSQTELLYNDNGTLYGSMAAMYPEDGMYKVRGNGAAAKNIINLGSSAIKAATADGQKPYEQEVNSGWNWITYPYEFDLEMSELASQFTENAHEGDVIKGQTTLATFEGKKWILGDGFKFQAGKGYMYYNAGDAFSINYNFSGKPLCYQDKPAGARVQAVHPWKLQNQGFADNMASIVRIEGLPHAENYVIGAFVGNECRGQGSVVKDDIMMLSVAGKSGEKVSFRLYDKESGEETILSEQVSLTQMMGSIVKPRVLKSPIITGITNRTAVKAGQDAIYTISGQKLTAPRKGINVVGGKKVIF